MTRTALALTSLAALVCAAAIWPSRPVAPLATPTPRGPLTWGVISFGNPRGGPDLLDQLATPPQILHVYADLCRGFPARRIQAIADAGATPMVSLELECWHGGRSDARLAAVARGDYDDFFRHWAQEARASGIPILLRFGYEFNGDWFPWGGRPAEFVAAWRRAHGVFIAESAANVAWVWSANILSVPDTPENAAHKYYPGDETVDWVALDGYNFGDHHDQWHCWQPFEDVFAGPLADFQRRYPHKPLMLSEFGCAPGQPGQRAAWIRDAHRALQKYPRVRAVMWFNVDKRREREPDWRLHEVDGSLAAFNETFARPEPAPAAATD